MYADIHSHIIPCVDDGAKDTATALEMLRLAAADGTSHIVATPHYIAGNVKNSTDLVDEKSRELQQLADSEEITIKIHAGCEVFISHDTPEFFDAGTIATINGSSYMLIELPHMGIPLYTDEVLYKLQMRGLIPVIAHPERNDEILSNSCILSDFVKRGMLAQVNSGSITGIYGRKIQKAAMKFIKMGIVQFVASDAHTCGGRSPGLTKAAGLVKKEFGCDMVENLFLKNGMAVLENGIVPVYINRKSKFRTIS